MPQSNPADEAADHTGDEIHHRRVGRHAQHSIGMLHENTRRLCIHTHVNTHMSHNAKEAQQHNRVAQQLEATRNRGGAGIRRFIDAVKREQNVSNDAHDQVDDVQQPPLAVMVERPAGDVRGEQRCERLDELAHGERGGELIAFDEHGEQRVEGHLHERIADAQQCERDDDEHKPRGSREHRIGNHRQQHGADSDQNRQQHHAAAADLVHHHARGHGEDEEPEEHHSGEQIRLGVLKIEFRLDVVRGGAHEVDEAHDEEREHDGHNGHAAHRTLGRLH